MSLPRIQNRNNNDQSMNTMVGDMTVEEVSKIVGISSIAQSAKPYALQSAIFKKKSSRKKDDPKHKDIHYTNISLMRSKSTESGKIIPSRTSYNSPKSQRQTKNMMKLCRGLGLLGFTQ